MAISCDIFCKVVDNFGDAGVCWRLARQLAREQCWLVRLWIDDVAPLCGLRPGIDAKPDGQRVDGVEIRRWIGSFAEVEPAQIVVEAFACELPDTYVDAMAKSRPVWINLEYLSAEDWVSGCHGMASPHPKLPLTKHFFFPGFAPGTGGLLRERDADFGAAATPSPALTVSLFCYGNAVLGPLLSAWENGPEPMVCLVADGIPRRQVSAWLGQEFPVGGEARRGALALRAQPFVPQAEYDRLLGSCDLNFVRGEDSFVRAQWAQRPFVWQIYPQDDAAHAPKLEAFLDRYVAGLPPDTAESARNFFTAWNGNGDIAAAWPQLRTALPHLSAHAQAWAEEIAQPGYLAENLANFCLARL